MILWNRILVAVDDSLQSLNAVRYLAGVLGGSNTCKVLLLAVFSPPSSDSHPDPAARQDLADQQRLNLENRLAEAHRILQEARLFPENLATELRSANGKTISHTIMEVQKQGGYGTVVVGRRGVSKAEEFLFGSVSSTVVHQATDCCVWVVA